MILWPILVELLPQFLRDALPSAQQIIRPLPTFAKQLDTPPLTEEGLLLVKRKYNHPNRLLYYENDNKAYSSLNLPYVYLKRK